MFRHHSNLTVAHGPGKTYPYSILGYSILSSQMYALQIMLR
jgi:hypothetical protein